MKQIMRSFGLTSFAITLLCAALLGSEQKDSNRSTNRSPSEQQTIVTPPFHKSAKDAEPLPALLPASNFNDRPLVSRAYQIAHEIPLVLAQQPCYCNCDKEFGHGSLLDCYASSHTAGCGICLKETFFTYQMTKQGKKPAQIRDAIIRGEWRNADLR
jgi:hypothetical protein